MFSHSLSALPSFSIDSKMRWKLYWKYNGHIKDFTCTRINCQLIQIHLVLSKFRFVWNRENPVLRQKITLFFKIIWFSWFKKRRMKLDKMQCINMYIKSWNLLVIYERFICYSFRVKKPNKISCFSW